MFLVNHGTVTQSKVKEPASSISLDGGKNVDTKSKDA